MENQKQILQKGPHNDKSIPKHNNHSKHNPTLHINSTIKGNTMNNKKLGKLQKHMLNFCMKHKGLHHIARDSQTRNVALSLEKRGLIKIVNNIYDCWIIRSIA